MLSYERYKMAPKHWHGWASDGTIDIQQYNNNNNNITDDSDADEEKNMKNRTLWVCINKRRLRISCRIRTQYQATSLTKWNDTKMIQPTKCELCTCRARKNRRKPKYNNNNKFYTLFFLSKELLFYKSSLIL